ncbi:hypothetical protein WH47_06064, partial [Habropoda laboriosa]
DNTPAHSAVLVKEFLNSKSITTLENSSYSPDLSSFDFSLFPRVKGVMKGTHFQSVF